MKIIFIGDSHAACMKLAAPVSEDIKYDFFACPSRVQMNMGMLDINGKKLIPTRDNLKWHLKRHHKNPRLISVELMS